jgi:hypothetical protein
MDIPRGEGYLLCHVKRNKRGAEVEMIDYLRALAARIRGLLGDHRADRELDDEIWAHLELLTERYVQRGMTREEAA